MLGVYQDNILIQNLKSEQKASEFVPEILDNLLEKYSFDELIYANGPGSYMGIKISFLSLKTLSIVKNIPLFALSAFELNDFKPIRANKNLCFVYEKGEISLKKAEPAEFFLPENLTKLTLNEDNLPFYFLDAV